MAGLWKAWKTKSRFPTLPTSPLEISPKAGGIPTFPQLRRRGGWKSGKPRAGFPLSHRPWFLSLKKKRRENPRHGRASPPARGGASRLAEDVRSNCRCSGEIIVVDQKK